MKQKKYIITCPACGKVLFKSACTGSIEVQCPKCGTMLNVKHANHEISVRETSTEYHAGV